jgi:hypothetical protein
VKDGPRDGAGTGVTQTLIVVRQDWSYGRNLVSLLIVE